MDAILEKFWLPLLVAISVAISQWVMTWINNRARRKEKEDDYKRQDEVAARVTHVAVLARKSADKTAKKAEEVAQLLAKSTTATNDKLDVIHTLVNSNLTASMQSELDATNRQLTLMVEMSALKKAAGLPSDAPSAIDATKVRVGDLEAKMADRAKQQLVAEKQMANKPDAKVGG